MSPKVWRSAASLKSTSSITLITCRSMVPSFIYWLRSENTSLTIHCERGDCGVSGRSLSVGNSLLLTKSSSSLPVSESAVFRLAAQLRQRNSSGMMEWKLSCFSSHSSSCASYTFRKKSQVICSMRCASPLMPASPRMMFCNRFIRLLTAISELCYVLI